MLDQLHNVRLDDKPSMILKLEAMDDISYDIKIGCDDNISCD